MKTLLAAILLLCSTSAMSLSDIVTVCDENGCKMVVIFT